MKIIITDTSVFFDIIKIKALPEFFALDVEIAKTANSQAQTPKIRLPIFNIQSHSFALCGRIVVTVT